MIQTYASHTDILQPAGQSLSDVIWIDILNPTDAQEAEVEAIIGVDIPTRAEMEEIEISSRLYSENNAIYMTAILPANADGGDPQMGPVSFVLTSTHLVTLRYHEPRVFSSFPPRAAKTCQVIPDAHTALVALLEAIIDRSADILERAAHEIDTLSRGIFRETRQGARRDYQETLEKIGQMGDLNSKIRDSLLSLDRLLSFLGTASPERQAPAHLRERVKTLSSDAKSLTDHASFLSAKITFLLDATLGMINIEQNAIIKIFSVAAVIFLPPTLIASIYGMNFVHMPELGWDFGYPFAIGLMVLFAVLPYLFFKFRNWL